MKKARLLCMFLAFFPIIAPKEDILLYIEIQPPIFAHGYRI